MRGHKCCPGFLKQDTIAGLPTTDEDEKPAWYQLWMGGEPHKEKGHEESTGRGWADVLPAGFWTHLMWSYFWKSTLYSTARC